MEFSLELTPPPPPNSDIFTISLLSKLFKISKTLSMEGFINHGSSEAAFLVRLCKRNARNHNLELNTGKARHFIHAGSRTLDFTYCH